MTDKPTPGVDEVSSNPVAKKASISRSKALKPPQSSQKKNDVSKNVKDTPSPKNSSGPKEKKATEKNVASKLSSSKKTTKKVTKNNDLDSSSLAHKESLDSTEKKDKKVTSVAKSTSKGATSKTNTTDSGLSPIEAKKSKRPSSNNKGLASKPVSKKSISGKEELSIADANISSIEKETGNIKSSTKSIKKIAEKVTGVKKASSAQKTSELQKSVNRKPTSSKTVEILEEESQSTDKKSRVSRESKKTKEAKTSSQVEDLTPILESEEAVLIEGTETAEISSEEGTKNNRRRGRRNRGRGKKNTQTSQDVLLEETNNEEQTGSRHEDIDPLPDEEKKVAAGSAPKEVASSLIQESKVRRKMFVSVSPDEQVEVALCEEGQVQEYYVEMLQQAKSKGNIYKAIIHNVDANLQAAFVNYGAGKNGFLQIDEVHPEYYNVPHDQSKQSKYPPIQKALKPGQEILVQIVKEPTGNKGAFLTTYLSFAGRFLVLTPGREQVGVSRKVDDESERTRLREMLKDFKPGPGLGVIVRTVSIGASKTNLQKDLQSLKKIWKEVRTKGTKDSAPTLIHQEIDLTTRAIRDYLTDQVTELWIDDEKTAIAITEVAKDLFPKKKNLVRLHKEESPSLFERFNVQRQLDQIHSREVVLPSGGRLVIDPTEALTAIDINSGKSGGKTNFEDMAYRTNMEAAKMIPLQLRLRDIGGQIVADFIEMRDKSHWREVEKVVRQGMKIDRARYDVGKIGPFGMLEIVRQRLGSSAISVSTEVCPYCKGAGVRRNMEWQSQQIFKDIQRQMRAAQTQKKTELIYEAEADLAFHLLNQKRQRLCDLEQITGITLVIQPK